MVRYLFNIAKSEKVKTRQLWLENIPDTIYTATLKKKYQLKEKYNEIAPAIGEYDDPFNQKQGPVLLDFAKDGNTVVFGNAESGKETLLSTVVYELMLSHTAEEIMVYILDFGSEALRIYTRSPIVGDVVLIEEKEKIGRLFEMLQREMRARKEILSQYGGDYELYLKSNKKPMPRIVVMVNGYEAFTETYEYEYEDIFHTLTREGLKYGIIFIITVSSPREIRYRLMQNFKKQIALLLNNDDDYLNVFDGIRKKRPSHIFGRGLIEIEKEIYEFQTAKICDAESYNEFVIQAIEQLNEKASVRATSIPIMPKEVKANSVVGYMKDLKNVPIGIDRNTLSVATYNFKMELITLVLSRNIESSIPFVSSLLDVIVQKMKGLQVEIFDVDGLLQDNREDLKQKYQEFVSSMQNDKNYLLVIIGIDQFLGSVVEDEFTFGENLKEWRKNKNCDVIIVENAAKLKNHSFEQWYQQNIHDGFGIWVGNGINDQYAITVDTPLRSLVNNCGESYGYMITMGEPRLIKVLGVPSKEEEDG